MSFMHALLLAGAIFAFPEPKVNWVSPQHDSVKVEVAGKDDFISQCLSSGLELRYRYEARVCKRRLLWADSCEEEKVEIRTLQYDHISEGFRLSIDWLGDKIPAKVIHITNQAEALNAIANIAAIDFVDLGFKPEDFPLSSSPYMGIRVIADCKGDYNETIAKISSWLTLGLVDLATYDSGWVDFRIGA